MTNHKKIISVQATTADQHKLRATAATLGVSQGEAMGMALHALVAGVYKLKARIGVNPMIDDYDPKIGQIYFKYAMGQLTDGELEDELEYVRDRAIREGRIREI